MSWKSEDISELHFHASISTTWMLSLTTPILLLFQCLKVYCQCFVVLVCCCIPWALATPLPYRIASQFVHKSCQKRRWDDQLRSAISAYLSWDYPWKQSNSSFPNCFRSECQRIFGIGIWSDSLRLLEHHGKAHQIKPALRLGQFLQNPTTNAKSRNFWFPVSACEIESKGLFANITSRFADLKVWMIASAPMIFYLWPIYNVSCPLCICTLE